LNQVGAGATGVNSPTSISGSALTLNGKPEILYMGAEYCPFCAAERWALIVALDKFGTFTGIQYMQSDASDVYPNTPTYSFVDATYNSSYIAFVSVETETRSETALQTPTSAETSLVNTYDSGGTIPFVDFADKYLITSAQYEPIALRAGDSATGTPYNWTQVASQLNDSSSIYAQNIDGAANRLISVICKIDGDQPSSICSQSFADTLSYTRPSSSAGSSQLLVSDAILTDPAPLMAATRFAPTHATDWV
jgi:thiol-disulfide isomerase/thioredoxin